MAGSPQQQIDFSVEGRFQKHLLECGYSELQTKLAALVFSRGKEREVGEDVVTVLEISSRDAARLLNCSHRCVTKSADQLAKPSRSGNVQWFRVVKVGGAKPPLYVLDLAAARSLSPVDRLDELLRNSADISAPVETKRVPGVYQCDPVGPAAGVFQEKKENLKTGVFSTISTTSTSSRHESPEVHGGFHRSAGQIARPWHRQDGVTDAELIAAVLRRDVELLRWMYDVAVQLGFLLSDSHDQWLRFLTACHHCATAKLTHGRIARLIAFNNDRLNVSRCSQRSDQWAGQIVANTHRDPELVALGRVMETEVEL